MSKLLTAPEVAEQLGVATKYVYQLVAEQELPCIKLSSKTFRFTQDAVDNWVKEKEKIG